MDLVEALFSFFMLPGLFGYAWHRGYGPHLFWMIAVPVLTAMSVSQLFAPKMGKVRAKLGNLKFAGLLLFQVAFPGSFGRTRPVRADPLYLLQPRVLARLNCFRISLPYFFG